MRRYRAVPRACLFPSGTFQSKLPVRSSRTSHETWWTPLFPSEPPPNSLARFDILRRLGAGGGGEVFLARSRGGKLVAIKTVARGDGHEGQTADILAREASVCVRLSHPSIVQVRAFLEEPGFAALVFEYVPGVALARVLRLCMYGGVRLPDAAAWHIVERVLTALAYAHGFCGDGGHPTPIVHRDVSPSNILLDWDGGVKVADFGLAKMLGVSPGTRLGVVKGTLGCMAPEQARGDAVDERADVYAAALLAWRLATGRVPFGRQRKDEWELLRAMRNPRIPPLASVRPDLPEPLLDAVARALEPERERRTITAAELADTVRSHFDVDAGRTQLAGLLELWKESLERSVKRAAPSAEIGGDGESSGRRSAETLQYDEVALAFDDDPAEDAPTLDAHALPSDPAILAAVPLAEDEPSPTPAPVAASAQTSRRAEKAGGGLASSSARRNPVVWVAAVVATVVAVAWLVALIR